MHKSRHCIALLKVLFYLINLVGLIWWTIHSINAFNEWPTSSKVVLQMGDNGDGKMKFPVVTVCPTANETRLLWKVPDFCEKVCA